MMGRAVSEPPPSSLLSFAARRTSEQQRDFAIRHGVLRQIVVNAQRVLSVIAEELTDGAGGVGSDVLHRGWIGGRRRDHDGVFPGAEIFQRLHHLRDRGTLLADGAVDTDEVAAL